MKTLIFFLLFISSFSHAAFTASSGNYPTNNETCTDFLGCYSIFANIYQEENYSLNGNAFIIGKNLYAEYVKPSGYKINKHITFTYSDDCYMSTSIGMICGLPCNSENSCFSYGSSLCSGYISSYEYDDPANWTYSCSQFEDNSSPIDIDQLPDESIITSTVKGERGLRGQTGEAGVNGKDGQDGKDGVNGLDGVSCSVSKHQGTITINCPSGDTFISEYSIKEDIKNELNNENCFVSSVDEINNKIFYSCPDGQKIVQVKNGLDGADGVDGADGADGADGVNGRNGADGIAGTNGEDGSVVNLQSVADAINDGFSYLKEPVANSPSQSNSNAYSSLFSQQSIDENNSEVQIYTDLIQAANITFKDTVSSKFSFSSSSSGYQARNLDLGSWGQHDVSISRITQHFGGLANIIYFFATLLALSIVLSGVKL